MIRLATVFSGIGAIEHALQRMNIETEIVFACDNGDVDLDIKTTKNEIDTMDNALKELEKQIKAIIKAADESNKEYAKQLSKMLRGAKKSYTQLINMLKEKDDLIEYKNVNIDCASSEILAIVNYQIIISSASKKKKYVELKNELQLSRLSQNAKEYIVIKGLYCLCEDEIQISGKELCLVNEKYGDTIKKIVKQGKDIKERIDMLYDKLFYLETSNLLSGMNTYEEKKSYVDNLYEGKSNRVRESYLANYTVSEDHFHWNVAFLDGKYYKGKVDLFVGGSPCQSFSLVGKQRGLEDTRGTLFYEYARLIKEIEPKVFIYENVKAILSNDDGKTWEKMKEVFLGLGYKVFYMNGDSPSVLNAKNYGIPQNRERMFVVGFKNDIELIRNFEFPKPIPLNIKMQDLLMENVSGRYYLPKKGVEFVTNEKNLEKRYTQIDGDIALCQKKNQQFNWHGDFVFVEENKDMEKAIEDLDKYFLSEKVVKYVLSSGTGNFYCRPETDLEIARPLLTTMHKMHRAGVDNYVHTNGRLRKLTPRECLRLMGFCDSFEIVVSDTSMYQQAGNSIVVDVLIHIMKSILTSYPQLDAVE